MVETSAEIIAGPVHRAADAALEQTQLLELVDQGSDRRGIELHLFGQQIDADERFGSASLIAAQQRKETGEEDQFVIGESAGDILAETIVEDADNGTNLFVI